MEFFSSAYMLLLLYFQLWEKELLAFNTVLLDFGLKFGNAVFFNQTKVHVSK